MSSRSVSLSALAASLLLLSGCNGDAGAPPATEQTGGRVVDTPRELVGKEDPAVLSPPILVPPLLACGASVTVQGFQPGAEVEILANGARIGGGIGNETWGQTFPVAPALVADQVITATQKVGAHTSNPSNPETVKKHTDVYPAGLPRPALPAVPLYRCGGATVVDSLPPGGTVRVNARPPGGTAALVGQAVGVAARQPVGIGPAFQLSHEVTAESQICSDVSPPSEMEVVQEAPAVLPAPEVADIWDGGTWVVIGQLVNGAGVTIQKGGATIGGGGAPAGLVRFPVSPAVSDGDSLAISQKLCDAVSPTTTVTVKPCSALPPARMLAPSPGDTVIHLTDFVPGARVLIFASGQEVGDGGGPDVQLIRPLAEGETVVAIQILGDCVASTSHELEVGKGLEDPSRPGLCSMNRFEYGVSGSAGATTTDVSAYFNSPASSVTVPMSAVPLHAIVRYPGGLGPFPIVLIVHGNHTPTHASESGYDYLLDLLASHCMIAVSVDENFLNGRVSGEMDARAIVLLRHLQLWRQWHQTPGHQFFTKVDLGAVGLSGHSRGGEAITVAELFNGSLHNPADPPHKFNFGIRALYAIAPVDGQVEGSPIVLQGAHYYVMHGTHDGDVASFDGHRLYDRAFPVNSPASRFKGLLWVYGANHAQWNQEWSGHGGDPFAISPSGDLIGATDQMQIGKLYIPAFFLSGLKGWSAYNQLFSGAATFGSLPAATRVFQYQDPDRVFIDHYEEDDDLGTGSFTGVTNTPVGPPNPYDDYDLSDNGPPHFLWGQTDGLVAGWQSTEASEVVIEVSAELRAEIIAREHLAFRVTQTHESSPSRNSPGADKDLAVQLRFGTLEGPEVHVANYVRLPYPEVTDAPPWGGGPKSIQQTARIPWQDLLGELRGGKGKLLGQELTQIRIKFNRHPSGLLAIDEIQTTQ